MFRFIGRVFVWFSFCGGYQFVQYYFDGMFFFQCDVNGKFLCDSDGKLVGCVEEGDNEFMESEVIIGNDEGVDIEGDLEGEQVQIYSVSFMILRKRVMFRWEGVVKMRVRELS